MPVVVDFETKDIVQGSGVPPEPVGVSIQHLGKDPHYFAFGHFSAPQTNNCHEYFAKSALARVWDQELIFHNSKFDIGVAMERWGLPFPKKFHDTQFLIYLYNPLARELGLKPSAAAILGMPPDEQEAVRDWLIANQRPEWLVCDEKGERHKTINKSNFGAYIWRAPANIVGPYANGDVVRTGLLWEKLYPEIQQMGMLGAYERELKLVQVGMDLEGPGVRVDRKRLQDDYEKYTIIYNQCGEIMRRYLGDIDIDKPAEVARALEASPFAGRLRRTPTGKLSTAADALVEAVTDRELLKAMRYRSTLHTLLKTFFRGWLRYSARDGNLHPSWNQTRNQDGFGTRTGRFSCSSPNLTNVPTEFAEYDDKKSLEEQDILYGLDIPFMRQYILPDEGKVIVPADYNGQEMRGLAHFAEGKAMEIYQTDPRADFHVVAAQLVQETSGLFIKRKQAKITGFSLIYGAGVRALAAQLGVSMDEAAMIKRAYLNAIPGLEDFQNTFNYRTTVKSWGGRILPCEPGYEYKLCNYLIQGSAADQTKEALIRYNETREHGDLLMTVHDEIVIQVEEEHLATEVALLKHAMEKQPGWDVPFVAEVEYGPNYHDLRKYG